MDIRNAKNELMAWLQGLEDEDAIEILSVIKSLSTSGRTGADLKSVVLSAMADQYEHVLPGKPMSPKKYKALIRKSMDEVDAGKTITQEELLARMTRW